MEESANSSVYSGVCSSGSLTSSEESSWTMYIEHFRESEERRRAAISSSDVEGSAMISYASSCASSISCKKLRPLKKKRGLGPLDDEELVDTASSPVNSPKVSALTNMDGKEMPKEEKVDPILKGKFVHELDLVGGCTELKKRGLCLIPFAMLLNHYGG
ncbi:vascular-related unknown protein 4-like [Typha angustifolia]|uniref:vascular-related unknown protein 4-like n=1 Tax=Typha angustifolia TaxID=59011 RepID=UPI003C2F35DA